jgi:RNA polymerase sigma factor (TIGR02999 family)
MHEASERDGTEGFQRLAASPAAGSDDVLRAVYRDLHALAERHMQRERSDHTLQPTALVHEVWIKLDPERQRGWESKQHFLAVAARAMRQVLVDHARVRRAAKRPPLGERLPLEQVLIEVEGRSLDLMALDEALQRLAAKEAELARIVELRFFGGLTNQETGQVLGLSERQVEGAWVTARGWLARELRGAR